MTGCSYHKRAEDRGETCAQSVEAADIAVKKVFAIMGIDIDNPESVAEFQSDLRFGRSLRKARDHGWLVFVAAVVTGACYAIWLGIISGVKGN